MWWSLYPWSLNDSVVFSYIQNNASLGYQCSCDMRAKINELLYPGGMGRHQEGRAWMAGGFQALIGEQWDSHPRGFLQALRNTEFEEWLMWSCECSAYSNWGHRAKAWEHNGIRVPMATRELPLLAAIEQRENEHLLSCDDKRKKRKEWMSGNWSFPKLILISSGKGAQPRGLWIPPGPGKQGTPLSLKAHAELQVHWVLVHLFSHTWQHDSRQLSRKTSCGNGWVDVLGTRGSTSWAWTPALFPFYPAQPGLGTPGIS